MYASSGDENVVLAWINDEVGWGVYPCSCSYFYIVILSRIYKVDNL